jgi:hypothetical protein
MNDDVVEREDPYRGRAPGFALALTWGFVLACLHRAVTDEGPIRGRDGRVTIQQPFAVPGRGDGHAARRDPPE